MCKALDAYAQLGFDVTDYDDSLEILDYIEKHGEVCPVTLYRGVMGIEVEEGQEIRASKHMFASFDENIETAVEFATRRHSGVVFVLDEDAYGLPVYMHTETCADETEWLIPEPDHHYVVVETWTDEDYPNVVFARIQPK